MITFLIIVVLIVVAWLLKPVSSSMIQEDLSLAELDGLPVCSLEIENRQDIQGKIIRSAKRCYRAGDNSAILADRIVRILKKQKLQWPSYERWRVFINQNPDRFSGESIRQNFPNEIDRYSLEHSDFHLPPVEVQAYAETVMGYLHVLEQIKRGKDAEFRDAIWFCPKGSCCSVCESLSERKMPIDVFLKNFLVHPCSCSNPVFRL